MNNLDEDGDQEDDQSVTMILGKNAMMAGGVLQNN